MKIGWIATFQKDQYFINEYGILFKTWSFQISPNTIACIGYNLQKNKYSLINILFNTNSNIQLEKEFDTDTSILLL
jgi:hypothetical protein